MEKQQPAIQGHIKKAGQKGQATSEKWQVWGTWQLRLPHPNSFAQHCGNCDHVCDSNKDKLLQAGPAGGFHMETGG